MFLKYFIFIIFLLVSAPCAFSEDKPLYPNNSSRGRPQTLDFMRKSIKPEIDRTLDPKTKQGKFFEHSGEATDALEKAYNNIKNETKPEMHRFDRGAEAGAIKENHMHDNMAVLGDPENFYRCMDYQIIGICVIVMPDGTVEFPPYVKYHVPLQKVENVDQPLMTGYVPKRIMEKMLDTLDEDYYEVAGEIAKSEMYTVNNALRIQASKKGKELKGKGDFESDYVDKAIEDLQENFDKDTRFRSQDQTTMSSGYVYNEYHVMPTGLDYNFGDARILAMEDLNVKTVLAAGYEPFVHAFKDQSYYFFSDVPELIFASRFSFISWVLFPFEMLERLFVPTNCVHFNRNPGKGRLSNFDPEIWDNPNAFPKPGEPRDMLEGLVSDADSGRVSGKSCQGVNQGPWLPLLNTAHTVMHTTAAAVGIVKGANAANKMYPQNYYKYTYDNLGTMADLIFPFYPLPIPVPGNSDGLLAPEVVPDGDKVQWTRSELMDTGQPEQTRQCVPVEKWVLKYGDANAKKVEEGHWNVAIHWKYVRGCAGGGVPIFPPVPQIFE